MSDDLPPWVDTGGVTSHPGSPAMTLREKIARAICVARGVDPDRVPSGGLDTDTMGPQSSVAMPGWMFYRPAADTILSLLSDPANISDEMVVAYSARMAASEDRASYPESCRASIAAAFTAASKEQA